MISFFIFQKRFSDTNIIQYHTDFQKNKNNYLFQIAQNLPEMWKSCYGCYAGAIYKISLMIEDVYIYPNLPHLLSGYYTQWFQVQAAGLLNAALQ